MTDKSEAGQGDVEMMDDSPGAAVKSDKGEMMINTVPGRMTAVEETKE